MFIGPQVIVVIRPQFIKFIEPQVIVVIVPQVMYGRGGITCNEVKMFIRKAISAQCKH